MKQIARNVTILCVGLAPIHLAAAGDIHIAGGDGIQDTIPGFDHPIISQAIVRLADQTDLETVLQSFHIEFPEASVIDSIESRQVYLIDAQDEDADAESMMLVMQHLVDDGHLQWAEFHHHSQVPEGDNDQEFPSIQPSSGSFWFSGIGDGSELYDGQYSWELLDIFSAHELTVGNVTTVAVIDNGIDATHPLLEPRVLDIGWDFVHDASITQPIIDAQDSDGDLMFDEQFGHGTFVAGIVALVAPGARILPLVAFDDDGHGTVFQVAEAMFYAIDHGVEVIHASAATTYDSQLLADAVAEAKEHGIVVVAPAGNRDRVEPIEYPASFDGVLSVGASHSEDTKTFISNYGPSVSLIAPGSIAYLGGGIDSEYVMNHSVISAMPLYVSDEIVYGLWEGTSSAAAFVSGTAALIRSQHPDWAPNPSTSELVSILIRDSASDVDHLNPDYSGQLGSGRLSVGTAVSLGPEAPSPGDINNDSVVDAIDLATVLGDWGQTHTSADLSGNGIVNAQDLAILLGFWTFSETTSR